MFNNFKKSQPKVTQPKQRKTQVRDKPAGIADGNVTTKKVVAMTPQTSVMIAMMAAQPLSSLIRLLREENIKRVSFVSVLQKMKEDGADPTKIRVLEKFIENYCGKKRGRQAPMVGDDREYKAQQVKSGSKFIRLPVDSLEDVKKGEKLKVHFRKGQITVTKKK